jgi:hypothetical protein
MELEELAEPQPHDEARPVGCELDDPAPDWVDAYEH